MIEIGDISGLRFAVIRNNVLIAVFDGTVGNLAEVGYEVSVAVRKKAIVDFQNVINGICVAIA